MLPAHCVTHHPSSNTHPSSSCHISVFPHFVDCSTRYGGCEPQVVASYIGGVAAQEAVKQITHQFEPLNNTFIYNGINSGAARFAL